MDWVLRVVKGFFIGSGFILPGVSGGALAAVFGIYERLISFLANITKKFIENLLFFLPVAMGGVAGIAFFAFTTNFFLNNFEVQILWFFIGCIVGTMPALWKEAGKHGRKKSSYIITAVTLAAGFAFLKSGESLIDGSMPLNFFTWIIAGVFIGLGAIVPGLSPSNFLYIFDMYEPMTAGFSTFDFSIIIPIAIGIVLVLICLSKLMNYLFKKVYTGLFHFIFGIVIASTLVMIPLDFNYSSPGIIVCLIACAGGVLLGRWMSNLENKYKKVEE